MAGIVATLGPASLGKSTLRELIIAGVRVFRLNLSHSKPPHAELTQATIDVRSLSAKLNANVALLGDLQGPKHRTGPHTVLVESGGICELRFVPKEREEEADMNSERTGGRVVIGTPNGEIVGAVSVGHRIMINDGAVILRVTERLSADSVVCCVVVGGIVGSRKGINVPDVELPVGLTAKDCVDALWVVDMELDFVALSFVQRADDIDELRGVMRARMLENGKYLSDTDLEARLPRIVAKIEKPTALQNMASILATTDAVMVARGDLGVEMSLEQVPLVQKRLIRACLARGIPVIVATQMLESMITAASPTRAEVSDVANAVFDGTDCVMLSGESAVGQFPVAAVEHMQKILRAAESDRALNTAASLSRSTQGGSHRYDDREEWDVSAVLRNESFGSDARDERSEELAQAFASSAVILARTAEVRAVILISWSGASVGAITSHRLDVPVIVVTPFEYVKRRQTLYFGVCALSMQKTPTESDEAMVEVESLVLSEKSGLSLHEGDAVLLVAGDMPLTSLRNSLRVVQLGEASRSFRAREHWRQGIAELRKRTAHAAASLSTGGE